MTRADRKAALLLFLCVFLYLSLFVHGHFAGTDEVGVYEQTKSLWENGDLAVPAGAHTFRGKDNRLYAIFAVGQAGLALPFYGLGKLAERALPADWAARLAGPDSRAGTVQWGGTVPIFMIGLYAPLMTALLVAVFFLFERRLGVRFRSALIASALLAGCTYVSSMSVFFLQHTTEALTILAGFYFFHTFQQTGRWWTLAAASLVASSTLLIRIPGCLAAPALIGYAASIVRRRTAAEKSNGFLARAALFVGLPAAAVFAAHMAFNFWRWGTWIRSPYMDQVSALTGRLYVGIFGFLLSPGGSIFVYSPLLLLLPWTLPRFWQRYRPECLTLAGVFLGFLIGSSKFEDWTGLYSAPGPRYLFAAVPLLMLPLGIWLDEGWNRARRIAVGALAGAGFVVQLLTMSAHWGDIIEVMSWKQFAPPLSFVWIPNWCPLIGATSALAQGMVDPWIWKLLFGGPGVAAAPLAAFAILVLWSVALAAGILALRRILRAQAAAEA